jgi:plasmid stabilization system protein ParE
VFDPPWDVQLTTDAVADIENIVEWTARKFGGAQAKRYSEIIEQAVASLAAGPLVLGSLPFRTAHGQYRKVHVTLNSKRGEPSAILS